MMSRGLFNIAMRSLTCQFGGLGQHRDKESDMMSRVLG